MISRKLLQLNKKNMKYIYSSTAMKLLSLVCSIAIAWQVVHIFGVLLAGDSPFPMASVANILLWMVAKGCCLVGASWCATKGVYHLKLDLRDQLLKSLYGAPAYGHGFSTSEVIQVVGEGVDQLEIYYLRYLPQFFYSMIAAVVLFLFLYRYHGGISLVLFGMVPLIPLSIILVSKFAKRTMDHYWSAYTDLGKTFFDNLNGLTTLKMYQTDGLRHEKMDEEAEKFRKATMKVLSMQLNSITIMDLVAYGGTALCLVLCLIKVQAGTLGLKEALLFALLSAEFFIPMRLLGSFFHISMNGVSASHKIMAMLALKPEADGHKPFLAMPAIDVEDLTFAYEKRWVLKGLTMHIAPGEFVSVVGKSGSGKSTLAKLLAKEIRHDQGIYLGHTSIADWCREEYHQKVVYLTNADYIFKGSFRENLDLGNQGYTAKAMEQALAQVNLQELVRERGGLDALISEGGANLSGGQRQRLAVARGLLLDPDVWILDEITSNIDADSEAIIMNLFANMKGEKTVILISHRLANSQYADRIYVLDEGKIREEGSFRELQDSQGLFGTWYRQQQKLEHMGGEAAC